MKQSAISSLVMYQMNCKIVQTDAKLYFMMRQIIKEKGYMPLSQKEYRILICMKRVHKLTEAVAGKSIGKSN